MIRMMPAISAITPRASTSELHEAEPPRPAEAGGVRVEGLKPVGGIRGDG